MARNQNNKRRRPALGGAVFGGLIVLALLALGVGVTVTGLPWIILGAAIGGGVLGDRLRNASADATIPRLIESLFSSVGGLFSGAIDFFGDVFNGADG
ncbi:MULTISPECIES: hypothetical protein [Maricaulis]|uniref:hypothetical protein n=1 Tax=Maricaulis TaxID=74317 RepID=UPI0025D08460|nr:hypothetical protein [Maricaulis sp.]MDF1768964.1 hypothetical protein [Maricaulis sp.]